ncbi:MAG TPA: chitin deacetylase, partial [Bacteroidales bacterium]|nr:chitin deacetylase [Bacteroidales bacterium]
EQANLKKIAVRQGGKRLKVRILPDKALFTFDPYGGPIDVVLTREKL